MTKDYLYTTLDCGDNSCLYQDRSKPGGVRTNGGCRCFRGILHTDKRMYVERLFHEVKRIRAKLDRAEEWFDDWDFFEQKEDE